MNFRLCVALPRRLAPVIRFVLSAAALLLLSLPRAFAQAPPSPTGVTSTAVNQQVSLSWTAATGATSYNVKRSLVTGGPYATVGSPTGATYTDTGLNNGTTYFYVVSAVNTSGESPNSTEVSATPQPPPDAPTALVITSASNNSISLSWTAGARATNYKVKRSSASTGPFATVANTTATSFGDTGLTQDTIYYYVVSSTNPAGESGSSNEVAGTTAYTIVSGSCGTAPPQQTPPYPYVTSDKQVLNPVTSLAVTSVSYPQTIKLSWSYSGQVCNYHFVWTRTSHPQTQPPDAQGVTANRFLNDSFPFVPGTTYTYTVQVVSDTTYDWTSWTDHGTTWYNTRTWLSSPVATLQITPQQVAVSDNQAVDSRYDLRDGNPTFLNFQFGSNVYKGGLFVGNETDPSRVGRSFLKFNFPTLPSGQTVWVGAVNAYCTTTMASSTAGWQVGAQALTNTGWSGAGLNWSNAPTLDPSAATQVASVTYTTTDPASYWCTWMLTSDLTNAVTSSLPLSIGLADKSESANQTAGTISWCYFAKKEFSTALGANAVYVYGPGQLCAIGVGSGTILTGSSITGTVYLSDPAPTGGAVVSLSSSDTGITVPASVTVPAGQTSVSFTIGAVNATANLSATITGSYIGTTATATVTTYAGIAWMSMNPGSIPTGQQSAGTVTLSGPAPPEGAVVQLAVTQGPGTLVSAAASIAAGQTSGSFTLTAGYVSQNTTVSIGATYRGTGGGASVTVTPH